MDRTVILWDIDGTLLRAGGLAREVFETAIAAVAGVPASGHGVLMGGKTDPQIAREMLTFLAVDHDDESIAAVLGGIETELAARRHAMLEDGTVLPGAVDLLARLAGEPTVVQTVLTGNTRRNAACKLTVFGLDGWLDLEAGAYGSDDADRDKLVPVALARVVERHGPVDPARVWVVGDTPFDAACARAGGVRCALVATGAGDRPALDGAGADVVLDDLSDTEALVELFLGG